MPVTSGDRFFCDAFEPKRLRTQSNIALVASSDSEFGGEEAESMNPSMGAPEPMVIHLCIAGESAASSWNLLLAFEASEMPFEVCDRAMAPYIYRHKLAW